MTRGRDAAEQPFALRRGAGSGKGGYWFGDTAILAGGKWASEPAIEVSGGFGDVVRIPGTESFLQPAGVMNSGSSVYKPTIYRFDL